MARPAAEDVTDTELAILHVSGIAARRRARQVADVLYPGGSERITRPCRICSAAWSGSGLSGIRGATASWCSSLRSIATS